MNKQMKKGIRRSHVRREKSRGEKNRPRCLVDGAGGQGRKRLFIHLFALWDQRSTVYAFILTSLRRCFNYCIQTLSRPGSGAQVEFGLSPGHSTDWRPFILRWVRLWCLSTKIKILTPVKRISLEEIKVRLHSWIYKNSVLNHLNRKFAYVSYITRLV